jgi:hypothetical protein
MCVMLTRASNFSRIEPDLRHSRPAGELSLPIAARDCMSIDMTKETKPLWVWLSLALLAIGSVAYVTTVFLFEHIIGLF